eukprot:UN08539
MLFYNEKRSEIPFNCFTLPTIKQFELAGPNFAHEPHPVAAHLQHLPPEYPFMVSIDIGIDIELLQWPYEEDARDWHEDVMERRAQVLHDHEHELEAIKRMKLEQEQHAIEQEKRLAEQRKKGNQKN